MKEINVEIYINWDNDGVTVKFSDEEAEKLLALWKEAQDTILHDVEEEDYWEKFDPYEKIMKAYHEEFWERMGCYSSNAGDYDSVSVSCDIDGVYLDDSNKIVINQIFPPSE